MCSLGSQKAELWGGVAEEEAVWEELAFNREQELGHDCPYLGSVI